MAQVLKADLDEMVFEDREKRYGAFDLRKRYPKHLTIGTITIGVLSLLLSFGPLVAKAMGWVKEKPKFQAVEVVLSMDELPPPPPMDEEKPPPPPPPKVPPPQVRTVAFQIPEPTPEEEIDPEEEQTIATIEEIQDAPALGFEDKEGEEFGFFDGSVEGDGEPEVIVDNEPGIGEFIAVEEEPQPVNMADIKKLVGYPQIARDAGIQGTVLVRVLVNKNGRYSKHKVMPSAKDHPILIEAVEKHISKLKFTPAIQGGRPIKFWVNIPFNFKLLN